MTNRPCTVGLTGGLASGKSTVAAGLELLGAEVFDCDAYVHELYRPDGAGARDIAYLFGDSALAVDGSVDRDALAELALADPQTRHRLEGAIHPLVRDGVGRWLATLGPHAVALVEAALLVETGGWRNYDHLVVVSCRPDQQLERARARGVPADRVESLLAAQLPLEEKTRLADVVIDNSGAPADLDTEIERAWKEILTLCKARR